MKARQVVILLERIASLLENQTQDCFHNGAAEALSDMAASLRQVADEHKPKPQKSEPYHPMEFATGNEPYFSEPNAYLPKTDES